MAKKHAVRFWIFISFFVCQHRLFGQVYTDNTREKEKHFFYEVKTIDEFFERFNDDPGSFIRTVYKARNMKFRITRRRLIRTLFNYENTSLDTFMMKRFVSDVTNKNKPMYLDFYGNDWYAEINCKFRYHSSSIIIPVVLKVEVAENKGSKWMIVAVGRSRLQSGNAQSEMTESKIKTKCLSPTSHATNFVSLRRAFDDKENLSNYFEGAYFKKSNMSAFYNAIMKREIEFQYVTKIKYHFLLADTWIFTVEDFTRDALNSGWLINRMQKVSAPAMENYRNKLLDGN